MRTVISKVKELRISEDKKLKMEAGDWFLLDATPSEEPSLNLGRFIESASDPSARSDWLRFDPLFGFYEPREYGGGFYPNNQFSKSLFNQ